MHALGIRYYFLMRLLESYQTPEDRPIDSALLSVPGATKYFQARAGYVEIVRDERIERVFFQLQESCVSGGPLDKPYPIMFDTEREDPDKKTKEYLDNMVIACSFCDGKRCVQEQLSVCLCILYGFTVADS